MLIWKCSVLYHSCLPHGKFHYRHAFKESSCYNLKLAVLYSTAIKVFFY